MSAAPDISVVIEWENVLLSAKARSEEMLRRLAEQIRGLDRTVEVIVVCDPVGAGIASLETLLTQRLGRPDALPFGWRVITAPGAHYDEFKNRGAAEARGSLSVLVELGLRERRGHLDRAGADVAPLPHLMHAASRALAAPIPLTMTMARRQPRNLLDTASSR